MKKRILTLLTSVILTFSISCTTFAEDAPKPNLSAKTAISIDADTGEIIYASKADQKMYPASTTKLLTALLLTEHYKKTDELSYSESAKAQPEYSFDKNIKPLKVGQKMTAENVLNALLVYSANDMAYVIADNVAGSKDNFAKLMNDEIAKLNLHNTHFVTPNGLHDSNHYTTAYDLSVIGKAALSNPWIQHTVSLKQVTVETTDGTKGDVTNRNKIIFPDQKVYDPTCIGGKTGYTIPAGKCLVALFERNGRKILGVVMNSVYDKDDTFVFEDMLKLVNWSFDAKKSLLTDKEMTYKAGTVVKTITLSYRPLVFIGPVKNITVPLVLQQDVSYYKNEINDVEHSINYQLTSIDPWKLDKNASVGKLALKERNSSFQYKLYPTVTKHDLVTQNLILYAGLGAGAIAALFILFVISVVIIRSKNRKKRSRYYR